MTDLNTQNSQIQCPCAPDVMITDKMLRELANGGPERGLGTISAQDQAILCMCLPDICGELLAYRYAARMHNAFPQPATLTERLRAATRRVWRLVAA